jgi:hypothetical protein
VTLAPLDLSEVSPILAGVATLASFGVSLGFFEFDLLLLGFFGAGSGVLLRGISRHFDKDKHRSNVVIL